MQWEILTLALNDGQGVERTLNKRLFIRHIVGIKSKYYWLHYSAKLGQEPRAGPQARAEVLTTVERCLWRSGLVTCWSVLLSELWLLRVREIVRF